MATANEITKANVYHDADGNWYWAAWAGDEYDGNGSIDDAESAEDAIAWASEQWPNAEINEVEPVA